MSETKPKGSLVVVGTGIQLPAQTTLETQQWIERADKVLYVVADAVAIQWIKQLNPKAISLNDLYASGKPRLDTYHEMIERILEFVREGLGVCAVFYGHPGVYVYPSHRAVEKARREGFEARMLPGISAEDCLFADVGVDPASEGWQSYEATYFLARQPRFDPHSSLILWQIGVIGDTSVREPGTYNEQGLDILGEVLVEHYGAGHIVVVYEAAQWCVYESSIQAVALSELADAEITPISTLYVPPKDDAPLNADMLDRLGIPRDIRRQRSRLGSIVGRRGPRGKDAPS